MKQVIITIGTILFTTFLYGQGGVGINNSGNAPNTSAMLDVASTNKGLLIPRVSLTSTTDITTITNGNVTSLLVYNSATIADVVPGYYYWDGTVWKTIGGNDADADPTNEIQDLQLVGNNLTITNNGTPTTIDLSTYLDNTDDQNIDSVILNGSNLTVYIEDGTSSAVDLSSLSDHDWYEVGGTTAPDNITDDIYTQGNVGIGTSTPSQSLHTIGQTASERLSNQFAALDINGNHIATFDARDNSGLPQLRFSVVPATGGALAPKMTIDGATGNIGMGITNPTNKLSIGTNLGTGYGISVNSGSPYGGIIETLEATPSSNPAFWVRNTDGTNTSHLFRVQNNGNVGIGTIAPQQRLHINGGVTLIQNSDGNNGLLQFDADGAGSTSISDFASISGLNGGLSLSGLASAISAPHVFINNSGDLGVGTTTPTNKLDINGDLRIQTITPGSGADVALVADATGVVKQVAPNPVGEIIIFPVTTPPTGYLICDGSAISRTTYSGLFAVLGTSYGPGDGSTTFNLPDLRGEFVRGSDNGRGADTGRVIGSWQKGSIAAMDLPTVGVWGISTQQTTALAARDDLGYDSFTTSDYATGQLTGTNTVVTTPITQNSDGASGVTRPRNVAMNYCIRF